jgi:outer membrane biosynthesis protein TonB
MNARHKGTKPWYLTTKGIAGIATAAVVLPVGFVVATAPDVAPVADNPQPLTAPVPNRITAKPTHTAEKPKRVETPVETKKTVTPKPKKTKSPKPRVTKTVVPFNNCREVFEAGSVPIYPSHPRWNPKLDRDKDGMACEH